MANPIIDLMQVPFKPSEDHQDTLVNGTINPARVTQMFFDSMFKETEVKTEADLPKDAVRVQGIMQNYAFHHDRLESHRGEVEQMIDLIPDAFKVDGGGGYTFLSLSTDKNNVLWTSFQLVMEQFLVLAIGLGLAQILVPRSLWSAFPGGMPYVAFHKQGQSGQPLPTLG